MVGGVREGDAPLHDQRLRPIVRTVQWTAAEKYTGTTAAPCRLTDRLAGCVGGLVGVTGGNWRNERYSQVQLFVIGHTQAWTVRGSQTHIQKPTHTHTHLNQKYVRATH